MIGNPRFQKQPMVTGQIGSEDSLDLLEQLRCLAGGVSMLRQFTNIVRFGCHAVLTRHLAFDGLVDQADGDCFSTDRSVAIGLLDFKPVINVSLANS